jgi:PTH1 family peptidyl-tRNA hydrolase
MEKNIKVVIGLGNIGPKYDRTRHNIGFKVLDQLAQEYSGSWSKKELFESAVIDLNNQQVLLIKPHTFMNSSGKVVPFLQKKGITPEQILIVHDELEKQFGVVAVKFGGSHKGHNGLRSIIEFAGADFWRLRFGIGRPDDKAQVPNYVLAPFTESQEEIDRLLDAAISLIQKEFF